MKWCLHCIIILLLSVSLYAANDPERNLVLTIETDQENYFEYDPIEMTITARNLSDEEILMIFPSDPYIHYVIEDEFSYFDDYIQGWLGVVVNILLEPFGEISWTLSHQPHWHFLSAGTYTLRGYAGNPDYSYATYLESAPVTINVVATHTEEIAAQLEIRDFSIRNFPNPFNPETTISYTLPQDVETLDIAIYNVLGQLVRTLIAPAPHSSGEYSVRWDGRNNSGMAVPSGVYFTRMATEDNIVSNRMIMLK